MTSTRISKRTAAVGLAAVVALGGGAAGVAYAYPSGVPMTVSASSTKVDDSTQSVTVSLGNSDPRCSTTITVNGTYFTTLTGGATTYTGTVPFVSGRNRVRARTVDCDLRERSRTEYVVPDAAISGPSSVAEGGRVRYRLSGLEPGTTVTVQAVEAGGAASYSDTDVVNRRGEASVRFRFRVAGTYAVTASVNGSVVTSTSITVS